MGKKFLKFQECLDYTHQYLPTWRDDHGSEHSKNIRSMYKHLFEYKKNPGLRVMDINQTLLDEMMIDHCRAMYDHSNLYIGKIFTVIQTALNFCIDKDKIDRFSAEMILKHGRSAPGRQDGWITQQGKYAFIKPNPEKREVEILTYAQVDHWVASCRQWGYDLIGDTIYLMCYTGMGYGEWSQLQARDIDLHGQVPTIHIGRRSDFRLKRGARARKIYISPNSPQYQRLMPILTKHMNGLEDHPTALVFGDYWGDDDAHRRQFNQTRAVAGIPSTFTPYCCRHLYGTWSAMEDVHPEKTARNMGHSQYSTTKKYYTHMPEEQLVEANSRIGVPLPPELAAV